jgi:hypothetical protein
LNLLRKIAFVLLLISAIGLGIAGYLSLRSIKQPSAEALGVMPDSCLLYAEVPSFHELNVKWNEQSLLAVKWKSAQEVLQFSNIINELDSVLQSTSFLNERLANVPVSFALYDESTVQWLAVLKLKELKHEKEVETFLEKEDLKVLNTLRRMNISFRLKQGLLLLSSSSALMDRSEGSGVKLIRNQTLTELLQGVSASDVFRYYIDHKLWNHSKHNLHFKLPSFLNASAQAASVRIQPNELVFNGNFLPDPSGMCPLMHLQKAIELNCFNQLPSKTSSFKSFAISNPEAFVVLYNEKKFEDTYRLWQNQNQKAMYLLDKEFYDNLDNSFSDFIWQGKHGCSFFVKDTLVFDDMCKSLFKKDTITTAGTIFYVADAEFMNRAFFGIPASQLRCLFRLGNSVYASEDSFTAVQLVAHLTAGNVLKRDEDFMQYAAEHINPKAGFIYYLAPQQNKQELLKWININSGNDQQYLENLTDAALVITPHGNHMKFRAQLNYQSPSSNGLPNLLWQCKLDTVLSGQPFLFTNHITKERELIAFDALNQLYLINSKGEVLWKKQLNETPKSNLVMVDVFKNNKYQVMFNTDHYLHLIDRNGNDVQGYPVKLPAKASNAMSLIDYEGNHDYRVFIACENKAIYNFNLFGVRAEGYTPYRTENNVKLPVKFARVGLSDYLITIDELGVIHAFSRKGDARIGFKNKAVENCSDFSLMATNSIYNTYLLYVDEKNNLVNKVSFADKKEIVKLREDITNNTVFFQRINNDYTPDFIAISEQGVRAFDINGNNLFENLQLPEVSRVEVKEIKGRDVGVLFSKQSSIACVLPGMKGKQLRIEASAMPAVYDLFKDNRLYLINGSGTKLQCFLLK